jgi:hypothetical protein
MRIAPSAFPGIREERRQPPRQGRSVADRSTLITLTEGWAMEIAWTHWRCPVACKPLVHMKNRRMIGWPITDASKTCVLR